MQKQSIFFHKGDLPPSPDERNSYLDPQNKASPYYGFVGNRKAVNRLMRIDFDALGKHNHCTNELNVAFLGPPGTGKTDLAKRHNRARGLPFVEISPQSTKKVQDLFDRVEQISQENDLPLSPIDGTIYFPPIDIFIDEVHALNDNVVQGLLKATEPSDGILTTETGIKIDCYYVHWMIATTDRGRLFDAFDTRFAKVYLNFYTKDEISEIIKHSFPEFSREACDLVSFYCSRIPREALAFAREMKLEYNMRPNKWENIAAIVAEDNEIDEFGMTYQRLNILRNLKNGPIAEKRMSNVAGCKKEELDKFIMPWLLESVEGQESLVSVTNKGYTLTENGLKELNRRKT